MEYKFLGKPEIQGSNSKEKNPGENPGQNPADITATKSFDRAFYGLLNQECCDSTEKDPFSYIRTRIFTRIFFPIESGPYFSSKIIYNAQN